MAIHAALQETAIISPCWRDLNDVFPVWLVKRLRNGRYTQSSKIPCITKHNRQLLEITYIYIYIYYAHGNHNRNHKYDSCEHSLFGIKARWMQLLCKMQLIFLSGVCNGQPVLQLSQLQYFYWHWRPLRVHSIFSQVSGRDTVNVSRSALHAHRWCAHGMPVNGPSFARPLVSRGGEDTHTHFSVEQIAHVLILSISIDLLMA